MTLGTTDRRQYNERDLSDGVPLFADLLSFDRFLHRAGLVKKQTKAFFAHPLFFEFNRVSGPEYAHAMYLRNLDWIKHGGIGETASGTGTHGKDEGEEVLAVTDMDTVTAYTGSSVGNINLLFPAEYPIPLIRSRLVLLCHILPRRVTSCHHGGYDPEDGSREHSHKAAFPSSGALPPRIDLGRAIEHPRVL